MKITIELPDVIHARLLAVQAFLQADLERGETVPTIEELILDAVRETWGR